MKKLIWANRKVNMSTKTEMSDYISNLKSLLTDVNLQNVDITICPQMAQIWILWVQLPEYISLGSQNLSQHDKWAFTGETSSDVLVDLGTKYVLVGHGERRSMYGDDDNVVNAKLLKSISKWIRPILCIGETKDQRLAGEALAIIKAQFDADTAWISDLSQIDIAYEPIWSIGTGLIPTREEIAEVHNYIRNILWNTESRILYWWSSNEANAADLITIDNVDGFLVWWASLVADKFATMIKAIA